VILLDEPTTSLTSPECDRLFALMDRLRTRGVSMIYISHNLPDVLRVCDDIAVLRDGRVVSHGPRSEYDTARIVTEMVGRSITQSPALTAKLASGPVALEAHGISRTGVLWDIQLTLHSREILGIAGMMGAGRTELARTLFGLDTIDRGHVKIHGRRMVPSPRRCIQGGMAFLTENRREEGLMMDVTLLPNAGLASLPTFSLTFLSLVSRLKLRREIELQARAVHLSTASVDRQVARTLSGGNQQKLVLAKWLLNNPSILILDESKRGIDVGARQEIHRLIHTLADQGTAVLLISSDLEELMELSDCILVMAGGHIRDHLDRPEFNRERILRAALTRNHP